MTLTLDASSAAPARRRTRLNARLKIGIVLVGVIVLSALILPIFHTGNPASQGEFLKNMPASFTHPLGTNALGQDIFWFLVFAVRNSVLLGLSVAIISTAISTLIGIAAGYIGGWFERIVMIFTDTFITIPVFPILIVLSAFVRGNTSFTTIGVILVAFGWAWNARTIRSMALSLREREFINMARFSGANTWHVITREIFPFVYAYMVVGLINNMLFVINTEASLAVVGLSNVQVPTLGSIIFWALKYNAMMIGQPLWIIGPIAATVGLFLGLFLLSTGYNEYFAERRGVA
jgi:peptide/nickel transport system permease protein